ncbi:DUF983 domain-containing protein [Sphingomonas sp. KC8]|uniref:DUF983 domain-containing protein n=1 Tax=Sphingomonas sp. KC8 TaxID=1030157 RepID=UPI0002489FE5|nr:DUF983 domain-containing protein [Sphingomonas sp. KC8]ARS27892.1 membrane protein [Sphingomonas sp. KC8]
MVAEQEAGVAIEGDKQWPRLEPISTGIRGRCPRCGQGHLFKSFLKLADGCDVCGLSYAFADPADGPAFFVIIFGCVPAVTFALLLEIAWTPPLWVHLATSVPFLILTCVLPLRPLKGWLVCSQFFFKAREGRIAEPWHPYGADGPAVMPAKNPW